MDEGLVDSENRQGPERKLGTWEAYTDKVSI